VTALITAALDSATGIIQIEKGCIFHGDRGSNYTSDGFGRHLAQRYKMRRSVGRTGVCWDNAMAESFFGALKNEWLNRRVLPRTQSTPCGCAVRRGASTIGEGFISRTGIGLLLRSIPST
jgi:transposase InsO family protein